MSSLRNAIIFTNLSRAFSGNPNFPRSTGRFRKNFSDNSSSQSSEGTNAREVFRKGEEGETYKDNETVTDVGNRAHEVADKVKESTQNSMDRTGEKMKEELKGEDQTTESWKAKITGNKEEESIMDSTNDVDEDELKRKVAKEPGGKPVDEDEGLDVNWRAIDEKKSPV